MAKIGKDIVLPALAMSGVERFHAEIDRNRRQAQDVGDAVGIRVKVRNHRAERNLKIRLFVVVLAEPGDLAWATGTVQSMVTKVPLTKSVIRALRLLPPEVLGEPVETERLERRRQRLPALPVVADLAVPGVDHLLPLLADGLTLGAAVDRRRAVPRRRAVDVRRETAPERRSAQDGGRPPTEADCLRHGDVPAGGCVEGAGEVLE